MKSYLFFILSFVLVFICFSLGLKVPAYAQKSAQGKVQVSAYVDEHIGYRKNGDKLSFATNLESGFWILSGDRAFFSQNKTMDTGYIEGEVLVVTAGM